MDSLEPAINERVVLYQILARDWLLRMPLVDGRPRCLNEISVEELDKLENLGFNWLYLLGVWQTGVASREVSRNNPSWRAGYQQALSDFTEEDVSGSPFAVGAYQVHPDFGGDAALAELRTRLQARGMKLMLDFVPNHLGLDHAWIHSHPEYFIRGTDADLERDPNDFVRCGESIFARGRDPYFPGWIDTVQLDYSQDETRHAMASELQKIAGQCDGLRCDMAMLLLPEVFQRTWNRKMQPFWPDAIRGVREQHPNFTMVAEVYWNLEWELQHQGFDFTYDKTLYDRLIHRDVDGVQMHLRADLGFQKKLVRFLENHDEPRIANELSFAEHRAAALIAYAIPGLRFFHDGQLEGARRRASIHLRRREREATDQSVWQFYQILLQELRGGGFPGEWKLLTAIPAWEGNPSAHSVVGSAWMMNGRLQTLVAVNFSDHQSQCYLQLNGSEVPSEALAFRDVLSGTAYERTGTDLASRGLYIDLPAWGAHLLRVESAT